MFPVSVEEAWLRARRDPSFFAGWLLRLRPTAYQARFLTDMSKRQVLKWSRQSGKSTCLAVKALWFAIFHPQTTTLIISPSLRQSINLRDIVAGLVERLPQDARKNLVEKTLRTTLYLWRGSRILALPANPNTLRGFTAHMVLVDEADFFQNPEAIFYGTVYPMLTTTDGWLIVSSTPWTTKGFFHRICQPGSGYTHHFINWRDAVQAGVAREAVIREAMERNPPEVFRREYECEFVEDVDVFLPSDLIARCIDSQLEYTPFEAEARGEFYVGCDFGKHQDYSVVAVVEKKDDVISLVHLHRFPLETPYASVIGYVKALCDRWRSVAAVRPDMTGVGDFIVEEMQRAGIPSVEGVKFTRESKEAIAVPVKQAMISGRVRIPYDRDLIAELNVERYEMSKDGHYVFSHPERSHDDRFWAFCLAAHAALGRGEGGAIIGGVRR